MPQNRASYKRVLRSHTHHWSVSRFQQHLKSHSQLPVLCNGLYKQRKKDCHFCTWNCSIRVTSIWKGVSTKHLTLPEIWWHNRSWVQRLFHGTRVISVMSRTLIWIKFLLTTHRNLLLRFTEAAELTHCGLMGVWQPSVLQPPSAVLTCALGGILAWFGRQLGSGQRSGQFSVLLSVVNDGFSPFHFAFTHTYRERVLSLFHLNVFYIVICTLKHIQVKQRMQSLHKRL